MPCFSSYYPENEQQSNGQFGNFNAGSDSRTISNINTELSYKNNELEASLCAIITELRNMGLAEKVLPAASRHGLIDLMKFWKDHEASDIARLSAEIHKYSVHEQEIIKKLLK